MKHPAMQAIVDGLQQRLFGKSGTEARRQGICVTCKGDARSFTMDIYRLEYQISGMCEKCQIEVFCGSEQIPAQMRELFKKR